MLKKSRAEGEHKLDYGGFLILEKEIYSYYSSSAREPFSMGYQSVRDQY